MDRDLVDKASFERLMAERGISNDTTVILYADKNNWFAAYAYWYLKTYGHEGSSTAAARNGRRGAPAVNGGAH